MANKRITDLQLISALTDDCNFPTDDGSQTYRVTAEQILNWTRGHGIPSSYAAGVTYSANDYVFSGGILYKSLQGSNVGNTPSSSPTYWLPLNEYFDQTGPEFLENYSLVASVSSNALTIALKDAAGNNPTTASPVRVAFRSATSSNGNYSVLDVTAATSIVVPSGATLGHTSGNTEEIFVYLLNNDGTGELLVTATPLSPNDNNQSTTTIDTNSDSRTGKYTTTGRTNKTIRYLGKMGISQATAGTWASSPLSISLAFPTQTAPTLSNADATKMGLKEYRWNIAYNNSIEPTITVQLGGTLSSVDQGVFIPYQMQSGVWRMKFNIKVTTASGARTGTRLAINGVTFASVDQAHYGTSTAAAAYVNFAATSGGTGRVEVNHASATTTVYFFGGDVELDSKPTWAF